MTRTSFLLFFMGNCQETAFALRGEGRIIVVPEVFFIALVNEQAVNPLRITLFRDNLVAQEGIVKDHSHIIWLDNLFTSARLLTRLDEEGFGAAGTVRTSTTRREDLEATNGTQAQQASTEPNRGLDPRLLDLRNTWNSALDWGKLYGSLSENKRVLELAWKDQNVVLFMTTFSNSRKKIKRLRRRPAKTATNARTSRAMFGEEARKELAIPEFIDMYNHYMNGVDNAD